jgi:hypothetical protein
MFGRFRHWFVIVKKVKYRNLSYSRRSITGVQNGSVRGWMRTAAEWSVALLSIIMMTSCAVRVLEVTPLDTTTTEAITVRSPVKAHLTDGSTIVFENGVGVADGEVTGDGLKYDVTLQTSIRVSSIPLEDVAAMERFETPFKAGATAGANVATATIGGFGAVVLLMLLVAMTI